MSQTLNDPSAPLSAVRHPACALLAAGQPVAGLVSAEITSTNNYHADTFRADLSVNATGAPPAAFWFGAEQITIEIQAGFQGGALATLLVGEVDHLEWDAVSGVVRIEGRDLSRRLIDAKTQETFQNQTSSQIATTLAQRHGLTPVVTATTTLVSRYYSADHDHTTGDTSRQTQTEWDLLVYLARHEGFDLFMQGYELHFQPAAAASTPPYVVRVDFSGPYPDVNAMSLRCERALTLAADIQVWVRSWSAGSKSGFTVKSGGKVGKSSGTPQRYVVVRPNLTRAQAQALANSVRADLTRHERLVDIELPGDISPTPRDMLLLQGTGTSCDQSYHIDKITRTINVQRGFAMTLACKNVDPHNQSIPA